MQGKYTVSVLAILGLLLILACPVPSPVFAEDHEEEEEWREEECEEEWEEKEEWIHELEEMEELVEDLWDEEIEGFLREELPELLERLERLEEETNSSLATPDARFEFLKFALDVAKRASDLARMAERDEGAFEVLREEIRLEMRLDALAKEYHECEDEDDEGRKRVHAELEKALEEAFGVSQKVREIEIRHIEEEVEEIRRMLEERTKNRGLIIQRRLHELLHGNDPFEW